MWTCVVMALVRSSFASDLDGDALPIARGSEGEPAVSWQPPGAEDRGRLAAGLRLEGVSEPALFTTFEEGTTHTEALLQTGFSIQPHFRWSVVDRLDLAVSFPWYFQLSTYLGETRALGDLLVAAPIRFTGDGALALGLVPLATLPTGDPSRLVSRDGPTLGALAVGGLGRTTRISGEAGVVAGPSETLLGQGSGPFALPLSASFSQKIAGPVWLEVEGRATPAFGTSAPAGLGDGAIRVPVEGFVGIGGRVGPVWSTGSGGTGLTDGIGAAALRGMVDATWTNRPPEKARAPEVAQVSETFRFVVVDAEGRPVADAQVLQGGSPIGTTTDAGVLELEEPPRWAKGVDVVAERFETERVGVPAEEAHEVRVALAWAPARILGEVRDDAGTVVVASVRAESVDRPGEVVEGTLGDLDLPAGTWRLQVSAPGLAPQVRQVVIAPALGEPDPLDVVLLPDQGGRSAMKIVITDPEGNPVERARVVVDGVPVGTTASGGVIELAGLGAGTHQVEVRHEAFTGAVVADLDTADGATLDVPVALQRVPGSVEVVVRDASGRPVSDAVARFVGPRRLPPMALGDRGQRVQVLGPGEWQLIVTSPRYGVQERSVTVPEDRYDLIVVEVVLQADEQGEAELIVRLVDPDGLPVEGATVTLDDVSFGATSSGGTLQLGHLHTGVRTLGVALDGLRPVPARDVNLVQGRQEQVLRTEWLPGTVEVQVRGPDGPVGDARVRLLGEETLGPEPVGPSGHHRMTVPAGEWTAMVTSAEYGVQERDLVIEPDSVVRHVADFVLAPVEGGLGSLAVRVVGPDDAPVDGALVLLDGEERGHTASGGTLRLTDLRVGQREIEVRADPYRARTANVRLLEGEREVEVGLDYAPGAVRVHVHRGAEPVADAFVRFLGDSTRSPRPVDPGGDVVTLLDPGLWLVVATSPTAGVAEWDLEVTGTTGLQVVDLDMTQVAADRSDLLVQVVEPDGTPVEEAEVWIDGEAKAGDTQQGGVVLARALPLGTITLTVKAPDHLPSAPLSVDLTPGTVERIVVLDWEAVPVTVQTVDEAGAPIEATVQWVGPEDVQALKTAQGEVQTRLAPGRWTVIARSGSLSGEAEARLELGDEPRPMRIVLRPTGAVMAGEEVVITEQVHFDFGLATLRPDSAAILDQVARVLIAEQDVVRVEVQGHTDDIGGVAVNQALSQARAESVVAALVARGVPGEKLVAVGYGPTRPLVPNDSDDARAKNRRVQFEIGERAAR